jgi:predicted 2-oxoglutarate/Fe(II)-dependent dioxygenase YbiX
MLLHVPALLDADAVRQVRARLEASQDWVDGRATAG